jgi:hypothetical protein
MQYNANCPLLTPNVTNGKKDFTVPERLFEQKCFKMSLSSLMSVPECEKAECYMLLVLHEQSIVR